MKKALLLSLLALFIFSVGADAKFSFKKNTQKTPKVKKETKVKEPKAPKQAKAQKQSKFKKDVLKNSEYKELKTRFFQAEGYGDIYNCKVAQQKFCKVKDVESGIYVLCDRDVSRTQWESAKVFYRYGRCTKLN